MNNAKIYLYTSSSGDNFSLISDCTLSRLGDTISININDDSENTIIGISKGIITITRTSRDQSYTMVLEEGVRHPLEVHTHYGIISAELLPQNVLIKDRIDELKVYLKYQISAGEIPVISNIVKIKCIPNREEQTHVN